MNVFKMVLPPITAPRKYSKYCKWRDMDCAANYGTHHGKCSHKHFKEMGCPRDVKK